MNACTIKLFEHVGWNDRMNGILPVRGVLDHVEQSLVDLALHCGLRTGEAKCGIDVAHRLIYSRLVLSQLVIPDDNIQSVVGATIVPGLAFELNEEEIHRGDGMPLKVDEGEAFIACIIIHLGVQDFTRLQP